MERAVKGGAGIFKCFSKPLKMAPPQGGSKTLKMAPPQGGRYGRRGCLRVVELSAIPQLLP